MEFIKGHIYGFGKLQKVPLEFDKGFQIVFFRDDNEKNTLLQFLLDILFGQKSSIKRESSLTENYYKFTPWHTQDYRGNIVYCLNSGLPIHLHRTFGPEVSLRIYEGLEAKEITNTFSRYPNGELDYLKNHIDLNREIFTEVVVISQKKLESSGPLSNHSKISEHLRCLIDTGTTEKSIQNIITSLQGYLQSIGTERTQKRPRNYIEEQLKRCMDEYEQAKVNFDNIRRRKTCLRELKEKLRIIQSECEELQNRLLYARQYSLWRRKNDAKALQEKLNELTSRSFAYSNYRDFPIDQNPFILQSEMAINHAEYQKQRLQGEIEDITKEINQLELELSRSAFVPIDYVRDYQKNFEDYVKHISSNEEVLQELYHQREKIQEQIQEVEKIIAELPIVIQKDDMYYQKVDFAIDLYRSSLKETQKSEVQVNELKKEFSSVEEHLQPFQELFSGVTDFEKILEDYLKYKDKPEEEQQELEKHWEEAEALKHHTKSRQPVELVLGSLCFLLGILLIGLYIFLHKQESLWFASAVGLGFFYFLFSYLNNKKVLKELHIFQEQLTEKIQKIVSLEYIENHPITALLNKANVQHPRELQGLYDEYCVWLNRQKDISQQVQKAENIFAIHQSRTNDLFSDVRDLFEQVGISLENEEKIESYRRKVFELQEKARMYNRRLWDLREQYQQLADTISRKEEYIRKIHLKIKEEILNRIGEELIQSNLMKPDEPLTRETFHAYYQAEEAYHKLKSQVAELRKKRLDLHQQIQKLNEEISQNREQIQAILEWAGVSNISEWKDKCAKAEEAHHIILRIKQTELQLQQLLNDKTIEEMEQLTKDFVPTVPAEDEEKLQHLIEQKTNEQKQIQKNIQNLQGELKELIKKSRPLNEILEEKNYYEMQWKVIQYEQESILLAISMLQQLSLYRYHKIADHLQKEINRLFAKFNNKKYRGVFVDQDLTLKLISSETEAPLPLEEIPQNEVILEQLYFAMRVALMKIPHYLKEPLPLLIDDPFVQHDYPQLIQTLNTLKVLGEDLQIILFTYRNDIPDIANNLSIPVLYIKNIG